MGRCHDRITLLEATSLPIALLANIVFMPVVDDRSIVYALCSADEFQFATYMSGN